MKQFFQSRANFLSFAVALIPAILLYIFSFGEPVNYGIFAISILICLTFIWLFVMKFLDCKDLEKSLSEQSSYISFKIMGCTSNICLCESNYQLSQDSIVSFFLIRDGFEHLIGYGIVYNIQADGKIQIIPNKLPETSFVPSNSSFTEYLKDNRTNIIIKPTVTKATLDSLYMTMNGGNKDDF